MSGADNHNTVYTNDISVQVGACQYGTITAPAILANTGPDYWGITSTTNVDYTIPTTFVTNSPSRCPFVSLSIEPWASGTAADYAGATLMSTMANSDILVRMAAISIP